MSCSGRPYCGCGSQVKSVADLNLPFAPWGCAPINSWICRIFNIPVPLQKDLEARRFLFFFFFQATLCELSYSPVWFSGKCSIRGLLQFFLFSFLKLKKKKILCPRSEGYNRPINKLHVTKLSCLMAFCHSSCQSKPEVVKVMNEWRSAMMFKRRTSLFSPFSSRNSACPLMRPDRYLVLLSLQTKKVKKKAVEMKRLRVRSASVPPVRYSVYLARLRWVSVSECWQVGC